MTSSMIRVAVVEDNEDLRSDLVFFLQRHECEVVFEDDGSSALEFLEAGRYDVVLLDLGLCGADGLVLSKRLRKLRPDIGIIMLTARGMAQERLLGWQGGADAYIVKPAPLDEVLAVIRGVARRLSPEASLAATQPVWMMCKLTQELRSPEGKVVALTSRETNLLQVMHEFSPKATPRDVLLQSLGATSAGDYFDIRRLEVAISRLRNKIRDCTGQKMIVSVRNYGYRFSALLKCS